MADLYDVSLMASRKLDDGSYADETVLTGRPLQDAVQRARAEAYRRRGETAYVSRSGDESVDAVVMYVYGDPDTGALTIEEVD